MHKLIVIVVSSMVSVYASGQSHGDLSPLSLKQSEKITSSIDSADKSAKAKLDSTKRRLLFKIDSLKAKGLPTTTLQKRLDSLEQKLSADPLTIAQATIDNLEGKLNKPVDGFENAVNEKLNLMNEEGAAGANVPGAIALPGVDAPGASSPINTDLNAGGDLNVNNPLAEQLEGLGEVSKKVGDLQQLPQEKLNELKLVDEVSRVQSGVTQANELTDKVQSYQGDVKNIAQGNIGDVEALPRALEEEAMKMDELSGFQDQTGKLDEYKSLADKASDPNAMKEEAQQQAVTYAVNHFAGKEKVLQQAMDHMSKLKSKYRELDNLKDLPKRKPNEMKGKSFNERLVRGLTLQIQKSDDVWLDYNPYIGYRFYGRFTAGLGWNERVSIDGDLNFSLRERIYGPRAYADFKYKKGWSIRTDIERMNARPEVARTNTASAETGRQWFWSAFVGIRKEYQFVKGVKGNFQFLYNLYDDNDQSPYTSRVAVRIGFEGVGKPKVR